VIEDRDTASEILTSLVRKYEDHRTHPYRTDELPEGYFEKMLDAIVAFELPIEKLEAKFKLGQNRSPEDRERTIDGLDAEESAEATALAAFMREHAMSAD
jgi:transcriptional regulator